MPNSQSSDQSGDQSGDQFSEKSTDSHLTAAQERRLRTLCEQSQVPFDPDNYRPTFDLPDGYVAGWVGPVYYGIDPDGHASS